MNNLPTVQQFGLTIPLKSLAEQRFKSPAVSVINERDLLMFLVKLISETYFKCGVKVEAQELKAISNAFKNELQMFGYITIVELQKCFNEGYKERYGKYYGLNIKTFVQWLDYYIQNVRNEDLNKLKPPKTIKKETISEEEKQRLISSGMKKCLEYWNKTETILDGYLQFLYDIFYEDGFLPNDKEIKIKAYNDAKFLLSMKTSKKAKNVKEHNQIKEFAQEITKKNSPSVILKAKELIVMKFLRETYRNERLVNDLKTRYKCN